jgi:hypothetical protein
MAAQTQTKINNKRILEKPALQKNIAYSKIKDSFVL